MNQNIIMKTIMENKQTAVEWLIEIINERGGFIFTSHYDKLFQQAKEKEKEQIKDAWINGDEDGFTWGEDNKILSEQYYNETYKQQDNEQ